MSNISKDFLVKQGLRDPGYWMGGLVEKLLGPKRSAEAKTHPSAAAAAPAPAPAPAAAPATPSVGATMRESITATRRREAEAGLYKGGPIKGKGGPTDDKIGIKVSDGEFVVNAAAVDAVGLDTLHAINDVGRERMAADGTLEKKGMREFAAGGPIDDPYLRRRPVYETPRAPQVASPAAAAAPVPSTPLPASVTQGAQDFASGVMPGTRSVMRSVGEDFSTNVGQGQYGRAAAQVAKGFTAMPAAIVDDLAQPLVRAFGTPSMPDMGSMRAQARGFTDEMGFTDPATQTTAASTVPQPAQPVATQSQVRAVDNAEPNASAIAAAPTLRRTGNEFSGTGPTPAFSGMSTPLAEIQRQRASIADTMSDVNSQRPTATIGRDVAAERNKQFDIEVARHRADEALRLQPGRRGAAAAGVYTEQANQMVRERQQEAAERGATLRSQMQDTTARRGQDVTAMNNERTVGAQMRGQDITARTATAKAQQEQRNTDRQYAFDEKKYGAEQAGKNFELRAKGYEQVQKELAGMAPRDPNDPTKPDGEFMARQLTAFNGMMSLQRQKLQQQLERDPSRKDVADALEALNTQGPSALGPTELRKLMLSVQLQSDAQAGSSMIPFVGNSVSKSTQPITQLTPRDTWHGREWTTNRPGEVINDRTLRGGLIFSSPNADYQELIKERK